MAPDIADVIAEVKSTLVLEGFEPLVFRDYMHSPGGVTKAVASVRALKVLVPILFNPFGPVTIEKLTIEMKVAYEPRFTVVEDVRVAEGGLVAGKERHRRRSPAPLRRRAVHEEAEGRRARAPGGRGDQARGWLPVIRYRPGRRRPSLSKTWCG